VGGIRLAERSVKDPSSKKGQQISGLQQTVNAEASTDSQPKGVWEGRDAHWSAKAKDSILARNGC